MLSRTRIRLLQVVVGALAAVVWELGARAIPGVRFAFGTPTEVLIEFVNMLKNEGLLTDIGVTGWEAIAGLAIGTTLGAIAGLSLWLSEAGARVARPYILAVSTVPVLALAPMMIIWFGIGMTMKVAMATLATIFVAMNQAYRGARAVSARSVDVVRGMGGGRSQVFRKVIVPGSIDWVLNSMRLNIGFGLMGAFIGEFIASERGLGHLILKASGLYNVPRALAATLGITLLAWVLDLCAIEIERRRHAIVQFLGVPWRLWSVALLRRRS